MQRDKREEAPAAAPMETAKIRTAKKKQDKNSKRRSQQPRAKAIGETKKGKADLGDSTTMADTYVPSAVETAWNACWQQQRLFQPRQEARDNFVMVMPPPQHNQHAPSGPRADAVDRGRAGSMAPHEWPQCAMGARHRSCRHCDADRGGKTSAARSAPDSSRSRARGVSARGVAMESQVNFSWFFRGSIGLGLLLLNGFP